MLVSQRAHAMGLGGKCITCMKKILRKGCNTVSLDVDSDIIMPLNFSLLI